MHLAQLHEPNPGRVLTAAFNYLASLIQALKSTESGYYRLLKRDPPAVAARLRAYAESLPD